MIPPTKTSDDPVTNPTPLCLHRSAALPLAWRKRAPERTWARLCGVLSALACSAPPQVAPLAVACAPVTERSAADVPVGDLGGRYRWQFIVTDGRSATGMLELRASSPERTVFLTFAGKVHPRIREPYYGWTDLPFESIGAYTEGSTSSRDSLAPGIAVQEIRGINDPERMSLKMVLGDSRTRRDIYILHGAYIDVVIEDRTPSGFRGQWEAAVDQTHYRVSGHFCAERIEDRTQETAR